MASKRDGKHGANESPEPSTPPPAAAAPADGPAVVAPRPRRYLIAPRAGIAGQFRPMSTDGLQSTLEGMDGVNVLRRLKSRTFGLMSAGGPAHEILVAEMPLEKGETLRANAPPDVIVEHDDLLHHHEELPSFSMLDAQAALPVATGVSVEVTVKAVDAKGKGIPNAAVTVYGQAFPAQGKTDAAGLATVTVAGGGVDSIRAVYVKPAANFWDRFIMRPQFNEGTPNLVELKALSDTFEGFPKKGMVGWGQRLMGLERITEAERGKGIKVAIIDSGCDNSHPQLRHVVDGADLVTDDGGKGWTNDEMSHGTHCAGIIGARSNVQAGITGFAPAAEIHAFKVFPGGRFSDLIEALDMAIEKEVDVVNMSLGSDQPSELVAQKLRAAAESGIACIVAAGNSSGPVQFPGILPEAITVAAIGQAGQFPPDSYHALTVGPGGVGPEGLFAAKFSCFGPQVRLSGPGVAIVSTVPGGYAAWDGTSMATPHVTGLVALLLAHHPELRGRPRQQRLAALWEVLRSSATPAVADPLRGGAGVPTASGLPVGQPAGEGAAAAAPAPVASTGASTGAAAGGIASQIPPQAAPSPWLQQQQLMAWLYANPAIYQALLLRQMQLRAAGLL
ncbi:MAG: S8 family serine peptidase [Alphaproteobacteria bacterium]|nr:S8 family serine peptidase [Alphaproteobacteria bacterium]MBV9371717.1 S8 family serine peptidase [Alphaproteobacteria bacterium]MBV9902493.1 S8 family serine peptidase [Alphaproteobacteria bacterium]